VLVENWTFSCELESLNKGIAQDEDPVYNGTHSVVLIRFVGNGEGFGQFSKTG
jgi:hypothetical protein